nr:VC0807 family protein [Burkholderia guangdongensis]
MIVEIAVNLLLPWLAYRLARPHYGDAGALYASAIPPLAWSIVEFARRRRADALSLLVLLGIALSIVAMALGGGPRMLLMRESLVSGAIGAMFLVSLAFSRPLIFYLARATIAREEAQGSARFEAAWDERAELRRSLRVMTLAWGGGLTSEMLLRCWMVWHWSVERVLVVSPIVSYTIYGGLMGWTFWYRGRLRARSRTAPPPGDGLGETAGH